MKSLQKLDILEDVFEDNVRIYLTQRSKINKNIKETVLSDKHHRFFYYNNGITVTCERFSYGANRSPIVELEDIQVVNGSQTLHALFEAFREDHEPFDEIELLCRIYETTNAELSSEIAESTNSQNPVKSRDIRSNDFAQKKLEFDLEPHGFYYERKKNQYKDKPKGVRIDSEKAGQALMAFYNKMPAEAKDKKRLIFGDKYEEVFNDNITVQEVLTSYLIYTEVEKRKNKWKREALSVGAFEQGSFIMHASYYILTVLRILAENKEMDLHDYQKVGDVVDLYDTAVEYIKKAVKEEKIYLQGKNEPYSNRHFFKGQRPRKQLEVLYPDIIEF